MSPKEDPWRILMLYPLCLRESCQSFAILASQSRLRDCYVVARTILETSIAYCFIAAGGKSRAERAWRHALQKAYRDLRREIVINDRVLRLEHHGHRHPRELPEVVEALEEFSARGGQELRHWTPENLHQQIEEIDRVYGSEVSDNLLFALVAIFRHSSEIAHGTYFGAMFALGIADPEGPPSSPDEIVKRKSEHIAMMYLMLGGCIDSVLRVTHLDYPMPDALKASEEALAEVRKQPWASSSAA